MPEASDLTLISKHKMFVTTIRSIVVLIKNTDAKRGLSKDAKSGLSKYAKRGLAKYTKRGLEKYTKRGLNEYAESTQACV